MNIFQKISSIIDDSPPGLPVYEHMHALNLHNYFPTNKKS